MNRTILILLLSAVVSSSGQLMRDPKTMRFYSLPAGNDIDQNSYHQLVWACKDILDQYAQENRVLMARYPDAVMSGAYDPQNKMGKNAVIDYLKRIATPTSMRLSADLQAINFNF